MRPLHGSRFWGALTAVLAVGVIAALTALTVPYLRDDAAPPQASASASAPSTSPSATPRSEPTASAASALTSQVIAAAGEGWVLASAVDPSGAVMLTAIDPAGSTYPGPMLAEGTTLLAWLANSRALVVDPAGELQTVDLTNGAATSFGDGWVDPVAAPAASDVSTVLLESGPAGQRTIDALNPETGEIARVADAADRRGLASSADGLRALTAVGNGPAQIVSSSANADDASLGSPLGGSDCVPYAWDEGRQAIIVCSDADTTVWALEVGTGTFAQAATLPAVDGAALAATGSRVLVAGHVYGVDGTLRWDVPAQAADATSAVFTGGALALWSAGDDGLADSVALVRATGDLSASATAPDGYVGFVAVVPAP